MSFNVGRIHTLSKEQRDKFVELCVAHIATSVYGMKTKKKIRSELFGNQWLAGDSVTIVHNYYFGNDVLEKIFKKVTNGI